MQPTIRFAINRIAGAWMAFPAFPAFPAFAAMAQRLGVQAIERRLRASMDYLSTAVAAFAGIEGSSVR